MTDARTKAKLLSRRQIDPNTQCWIWLGSWDKDGYGKFRVSPRKVVSVHRLAAKLFLHSDAPFVAHKRGCNPACFQPKHLLLYQSRSEMVKDRRSISFCHGFSNPSCKLTPYALELIVDALIDGGERMSDIARRVSEVCGIAVNGRQVEGIWRGELWTRTIEYHLRGRIARVRRERKRA